MSDSLDERPAYCIICGKEIGEDSDFVVLVSPEPKEEKDGTITTAAVLVGECCKDKFEERVEVFDFLALMALFGQVGLEEN